MKAPLNPELEAFRAREGLLNQNDFEQYLEDLMTDSCCPAVCEDGCEVEPDGCCPHGKPSLLLALGLI